MRYFLAVAMLMLAGCQPAPDPQEQRAISAEANLHKAEQVMVLEDQQIVELTATVDEMVDTGHRDVFNIAKKHEAKINGGFDQLHAALETKGQP